MIGSKAQLTDSKHNEVSLLMTKINTAVSGTVNDMLSVLILLGLQKKFSMN